MLSTEEFDYNLPEGLIAQIPLINRSQSKLMILNRKDRSIKHSSFEHIISELNSGDVLVLNNTRVIPARIFGHRFDKEEKIEFLLLRNTQDTCWEVLVKPGKKTKLGTTVIFSDKLKAEIKEIKDDGVRVADFIYDGDFNLILDELGEMPLPPYIIEKLYDKERYQTVYSEISGSAAAPTAGLHFTNELMNRILDKGVKIAYITLHVGLGTFKPVKVDNVLDHKMHSEYYIIDKKNADIINSAINCGNKIIAVGTTSVRTLESVYAKHSAIVKDSGWTDIFIYPGFEFKVVDRLITNFHLPKSTLIMLVSAFADKEFILEAYQSAIDNDYRFFSFGDAMFIK